MTGDNKSSTKLVFFWDVDTQWGADRSRSAKGPGKWGHLDLDNTKRLLELHEEYNIPACFAIVGQAALNGERPYHDPGLVREIHAGGHEIASHSHCHEWLPGLGSKALSMTLRESKDALEQCIGAKVVSFVPPYNQPFDYPQRLAFSISERRAVKDDRTDLKRLCEALTECGYGFSRILYASVFGQLVKRILCTEPHHKPVYPEEICGITCLRLNAPVGFGEATKKTVDKICDRGGYVVIHGHPHSLHAGGMQDEKYLLPFLERIKKLRDDGRLTVVLPRKLIRDEQ